MTETKEIFYNLFWQNKACRNLFLLSKEELLDTKRIEFDKKATSISLPRVIISNVSKSDDNHQIIKLRTEKSGIKTQTSLNNKFKKYEPIFSNFMESKFGKSVEKALTDFQEKPQKLIGLIAKCIMLREDKRERTIIKELQTYGFIGKNVESFDQIGELFNDFLFNKKFKEILSEENFWNLLEFSKQIKDTYVNAMYSSLYSSNQILVNALYEQDNFEDRLRLFNLLYESEIIKSSHEDAFVECTNCNHGVYRGVLQLTIKPSKLNGLICPVCSSRLNYYVPYELHSDIYNIVNDKDGLLLDALCNLLMKNEINHKTNQYYLKDIEIDCEYEINNKKYIVECKMFKVNNTEQKLAHRIKASFGKLISDAQRIQEEEEKELHPILLINIPDTSLIKDIESELKVKNTDEFSQRAKICTIDDILIK